jgi:hypothetical protein
MLPQEEHYWREYSRHKHQLLQAEDEYRSLDSQLRATQCQLEKLKKTNVFNATFHIWHAGHFGTINGFRLGRLPSVPVDWNEVNTAWGRDTIVLYPDIYSLWHGHRAVLRIRDVYPGSRIRLFSIPDPGSDFFLSRIRTVSIPDPYQRT